MKDRYVSPVVVKRLPRYYRYLDDLLGKNIKRISSTELSRRMGVTASQIRQDLNCFGGFGQQGYGYNVDFLQSEIAHILGLDVPQSAILIGVGNLGRAVAQHINFQSKGFHLIGMFDSKESLVGQMVRNIPIRHVSTLDEFCRENRPSTAILCIPKAAAHDIAEQLIALGVRGFLNFSHYDLSLDFTGIEIENIHFGDSLMRLSYKLSNN